MIDAAAAAHGDGDSRFRTHEVFNQPPPLVDYDLFATDRPRAEAVAREGAGWAAGNKPGQGTSSEHGGGSGGAGPQDLRKGGF